MLYDCKFLEPESVCGTIGVLVLWQRSVGVVSNWELWRNLVGLAEQQYFLGGRDGGWAGILTIH